jgi:thiol-disulfide isomerase/thioredoxin
MRKLLVAAAVVGLIAATDRADIANADQDNKEPSKKEKPAASLKVGDRAPTLKASKWLQGEEVKEFEPGKLYVVEFWATWCGPCIACMPHMAELQAQYKDRGVTFIGYSARDPDNTEEKVSAFVTRRGPKLKYTFAYGDDHATYDAWITAAGKEGIPWAFVVDKAGRIAFIGNPIYLGMVLPKVVAGGAEPQAVSDEVAKIQEEALALSRALDRDPKAGLKALADFEAKYPPMANIFPWVRARLGYLPKFGKVGEAKAFAEAVVAKAIAQHDPSALGMVSGILRSGDGKDSRELMAVAVKAAEARVRMEGDKDAGALINLASTYFVAADKVKAKEYARKAVEAAASESAERRQYIEQEARKLGDDK